MKRILVLDDHEVVRIGIKHLIAESLPAVVWNEADTVESARPLATQQEWHLIILELAIDGNRGLELLKEIKRAHPKAAVLILTGYAERDYAVRAIKAGAAGYINKKSAAAELLKAVDKVLQGGRYFSASLAEVLNAERQRKSPEAIHELLSDREFQVLRSIGSGNTVGEIAAILGISDKTVSTYRARILDKTGLKNNAEAVRYVVENRLLDK